MPFSNDFDGFFARAMIRGVSVTAVLAFLGEMLKMPG
jgi:hypothetical protein